MERQLERLAAVGCRHNSLSADDVRQMIKDIGHVFTQLLLAEGYDGRAIIRVTTKLRDAGRRSPPWKPASSLVPGRPQHGEDGNRRNRWLFENEHKWFASEIDATLVEIKYFLQLLSMKNAPQLPAGSLQDCLSWLVEHPVVPGNYRDPIQLIPIDLSEVLENARIIQSGHLVPLDRGGRHVPQNAFLMLHRSNQLQGNMTLQELLALMEDILEQHRLSGQSLKRAEEIIESENR